MEVLVTGGAGFIGSLSQRRLLATGWDVIMIGILSSGSNGTKVLISDSRTQPVDVGTVARDSDVIFRFAANREVRVDLGHPEQCFRQNTCGYNKRVTG